MDRENLHLLTASEAARLISRGALSSQELVDACLARVREVDGQVQAWAFLDPDHARAQARAADEFRLAGQPIGPLHGVPVGLKDIIDTDDMPTENGSVLHAGRTPPRDAAVVALLRAAGAVIMGKTVTTEFATRSPGKTRNPHNPEHTPGGSSSGSAAAVAAGMVPLALGTQTRGSVLRPASFCGVTGFKPSYGLLPMEGVLPLSQSLDTLGFFTHTAEDMRLLWDCLGYSIGQEETVSLGVPERLPDIDQEMETAFLRTVSWLREAAFSIRPVQIDDRLRELDEASKVVMKYEGACNHQERFAQHGSRLGTLADLVREGMQIPREQYGRARELTFRAKKEMAQIFEKTPVILTPAATGPAPLGLASTGDPRMNSPWTVIGTPAISIPMPVTDALPLGLQATADYGHEGRLLQTTVRIENALVQRKA